MSTHERDGWASTTKVQRTVAFLVTTAIVLFYVFTARAIPALLPELLMLYFGIAVGGRIADRWVETKEKKDA
jgi:hypothetical protein